MNLRYKHTWFYFDVNCNNVVYYRYFSSWIQFGGMYKSKVCGLWFSTKIGRWIISENKSTGIKINWYELKI